MTVDLRSFYPEPTELAYAKQLDRIDHHAAAFIARSPFLVIATADSTGSCDASPRGDAPGFVIVADERTLYLPDRPGNNRIDSLTNITANPHVGLLFFIPGVIETLRVNGRANFVADTTLLQQLSAHGHLPRSALVIEVEEVFFHCGKALKRSNLWDPGHQVAAGEIPTLGRILADQTGKVGVAEAEERVRFAYEHHLY